MARITDRNDWFEVWYEDKESVLNTMILNMTADLNAGYDYFGRNIERQRFEIKRYKEKFDEEMDAFKYMDIKEVDRWCFYDLKKRGAIA